MHTVPTGLPGTAPVGPAMPVVEIATLHSIAPATPFAIAMECNVAISTTGIAGPTGAVPGKPVGTVCIGYYIKGQVFTETNHFTGDRSQVRNAAVNRALTQLTALLKNL